MSQSINTVKDMTIKSRLIAITRNSTLTNASNRESHHILFRSVSEAILFVIKTSFVE